METTKTQTKSRFLQVCTGISMVLVAVSIFMYSINTVHAAPVPKTYMPSGVGQVGKYILTFLKDGNDTFTYMTDTESGKTYFLDSKTGKWTTGIPAIPAGL